MKKIFLALCFFAQICVSYTVNAKTCEDIGAKSVTKQIVINSAQGLVQVGEPAKFCLLSEDNRTSLISEKSLLSTTSNFAATAYRKGPTPILDTLGERCDKKYCRMLGGAYQLGNVVNGGWVDVDNNQSGQSTMCVFADGSMISTWTLFYKRMDPKSEQRPDFEPFFENPAIEQSLW